MQQPNSLTWLTWGSSQLKKQEDERQILYAVRASQIYGNLNHLDNDFVIIYGLIYHVMKEVQDLLR